MTTPNAGRGKSDLVERTLRKVLLVEPQSREDFWRSCFLRFSEFPKSGRTLKRIVRAPDDRKDQVRSCLAEVWYALAFAGLGFQIEMEPLGRKGPDFRISREGDSLLVEVKYFENVNPKPPRKVDYETLLADNFLLEPYGNLERETEKVYREIKKKFNQTREGTSILVIWNGKEDMEELGVELTTKRLCEEAFDAEIRLPDSLLFVVYGSAWWGEHQFYCYPLREKQEPYWQWMRELQASRALPLIKRAIGHKLV